MTMAPENALIAGKPLALATGRQSFSLAVPVSVALHGGAVAAIAFGWQIGASVMSAEAPMDVIVVMEQAAASETPAPERARAPMVSQMPPVVEQPPSVTAAPPEPTAIALPEPEALPPPATETAFVMPMPPPAPPRPKPIAPKVETVAEAPPPTPEPAREPPRDLVAAALPAAADPGSPREAAGPQSRSDAMAAAATASFRGLPLVTEARFREPPRQPAYPRRAVDLDQKGTVIVRALVDPSGNPAAIEIWTSSGHALLDRAAEQAVRQWRFQPATYNARPTEAWVQVAVHFNLR